MRWRGGVAWWVTGAVLLWPLVGAAGVGRSPASILIDASTGQVLGEQEADTPRRAAFGPLMVLLLSLEQSALGALKLTAPVVVSPPTTEAMRAPSGAVQSAPSANALGTLRPDRPYRLSDFLKAVAVSGADDAATAVAEAVAGTVASYVDLMNARAERLGMRATRYAGVGRPSASPGALADSTTARDLARLAQALVSHPDALQWASIGGLPFDNGAAVLRNTNQLIGAVPGVDGLQVASTRDAAGRLTYSAVATAERSGLRLIAVVLEASDSATRYRSAADLLEWGFTHYQRVELVRRGERLNPPVRVDGGALTEVVPVAGQTLTVLRRSDEDRDFQVHYQLPTALIAPIERDQPIGEIIVAEHGEVIAVIPVLSASAVSVTGVIAALNQTIFDHR